VQLRSDSDGIKTFISESGLEKEVLLQPEELGCLLLCLSHQQSKEERVSFAKVPLSKLFAWQNVPESQWW
jgi:hypothetical protein